MIIISCNIWNDYTCSKSLFYYLPVSHFEWYILLPFEFMLPSLLTRGGKFEKLVDIKENTGYSIWFNHLSIITCGIYIFRFYLFGPNLSCWGLNTRLHIILSFVRCNFMHSSNAVNGSEPKIISPSSFSFESHEFNTYP